MPDWPRKSAMQQGFALIFAVLALCWAVPAALAQADGAADVPAVAAPEQADAPPPEVAGLRILNNDERARLIVDLNAVTEFAIAALNGPDRIVVDMRAEGLAAPIDETPAGDGLIGVYALAKAEAGRVRATLTLSAPAQVQQAYLVAPVDDQPARLIVDLIPDSPARFAERVSEDYKAALARQAAADAATAAAEAATAAAQPAPSPVTITSGTPRPLIVIDPGHGGIDGGAEAFNGIREKDVVFDFALELQRLLVAMNRFDVSMTRDADTFVKLEDRVTLARANKADLFISIHADKFEDTAIRGTSLYMRDEKATHELDRILAERENRADLIAGFVPPDSDERVTSILVGLMQRETRRKSFQAAQAVLQSLESHTRLRKIPLHRADFYVLQAPEIPALLIELGFLSNEADVANLTRKDWRDETADAIAAGIAAYFDGIDQN
ncbi:MAG: N-acetylmuramoyl-L-alanine amidase [Alphaproteobacteria bacterium]|nr:N-acetylmuramoyl-L-alanine amidase [Alphaproteobacteria bacterium]